MKKYPSQARLRELFDYDPEGFLVWRHRTEKCKLWNKKNEGKMAGSLNIELNGGFRARTYIDGEYYNTMKLIWIYHNGNVPDGFYVKSKSGAFSGMKIEFMELNESRSKTHAGGRINWNKHGFFGVRMQKNGYFQALSFAEGKRLDLGTYETADAAASAYDNWAIGYYGKGFLCNESSCKNPDDFRVRKGDRPPSITKKPNGFRGVCKNPKFPNRSSSPWRAIIGINGKSKHLGVYKDKEQAARAYNIAAYEHYGENAVLNDIPDPLGKGDAF